MVYSKETDNKLQNIKQLGKSQMNMILRFNLYKKIKILLNCMFNFRIFKCLVN